MNVEDAALDKLNAYVNNGRKCIDAYASGGVMPYKSNNALPKRVKNNLPRHAQTIYRKAFNNAEKQYRDPKKRRTSGSLDAIASKVAWSAVKQEYKKSGDEWIKR